MKEIEAKQILYKMNQGNTWFGSDYNMNLYRGCSHGCIYCDSRSECYQIEKFDAVRVKKDALRLLEKELRSKRKKGVVSIGAMSDTYNPFEKEEQVTRGALRLLDQYGFGVALDTKSDLVVRDIDLLKRIQTHSNVIVKMTITCVKDELSQKIEPYVCPSSARFKALKQLHEADIFAGILYMPILPFVNDSEEEIKEMVRLAKEHNAKFIYAFLGVTLRDRQREYYYAQLDALFPGLSARYRTIYRGAYKCPIASAKRKWRIFEEECQKAGILYKMSDIIKAYQVKKQPKQLSLF